MENFQGILSSVFNTALNAAQNTANRAMDPYTVHEILSKADIAEVSAYPVFSRASSLLLYGPVEPGHFHPKKAYHVILHGTSPNAQRMFSLLRTDDLNEAQELFTIYKENFPVLIAIDNAICDAHVLDKMTRTLRLNKGWSAPHLAAAFGLVNCLRSQALQVGLNFQEQGSLRTPLLVAIEFGVVSSVATLLELGADVTIPDIKNNNVFHVAASQQSLPIIQLLEDKIALSRAELLDSVNVEGFSPLHIACSHNRSDIVKSFLNGGASVLIRSESQEFPIHAAVKAQSVTCIQELVTRDPNHLLLPDLQDTRSPLHWAQGPETVMLLIESGCDPNALDEKGFTALHNAVRRGCLRSALHLLCHGAYPNMKGGELEDTPLHLAARLCCQTLVQTLIVFGADMDVTNTHQDTPLHVVCTLQPKPDRDEVQFILSAAGAHRCPQAKAASCVEGCSFSGSFNGTQPANFSQQKTENLMHSALNALSIQIQTSAMNTGTSSQSAPQTSKGDVDIGGGRLLCLDGGGIKGIVLTQMLMVIEQELNMPLIDLFDWVAGTSTGGILALALACKKTPLESQCIYMRLKDKVFVGDRPYNSDVMEQFLKQEFGDRSMGSIHQPRVMIMTALVDRRPVDLHIFRNYISPCTLLGEPEPFCHDHSAQHVWEAAKVTGAAPSYFRLDHDKFVDGGLISNNPTLDALTELQQYQAALKSLGYLKNGQKVISTVVSLGTGIPPKTQSKASLLDITWPTGVFDAITKVPRLANLVNLLIDQATQSEGQVVERCRAWCSSVGVPFFRYSPQMMFDVGLDEKDDTKLVKLLWETRCYMVANRDLIAEMTGILMQLAPNKI